jgi:hypothetical protein
MLQAIALQAVILPGNVKMVLKNGGINDRLHPIT